MLKTLKLNIAVALGLVLIVSIGIFLWFYFVYTRTPAYSLKMIQQAVTAHDYDKFSKYVDLDSLTDAAGNDVLAVLDMSGTSSSLYTNDDVSAFKQSIKDPLLQNCKKNIETYVRTGIWEDKMDTNYFGALQIVYQAGLEQMSLQSLDAINIDANNDSAVVAIKIQQEEIGQAYILHFQMVKKNGVWQVVGINDFVDYLTMLKQCRKKNLQEFIYTLDSLLTADKKVVQAEEQKMQMLIAQSSLSNPAVREQLKDIVLYEIIPIWQQEEQELQKLTVPLSAESLQRLRLRICTAQIAYLNFYMQWLDDKQITSIRQANAKLKESKMLEYESEMISAQIKTRNNYE